MKEKLLRRLRLSQFLGVAVAVTIMLIGYSRGILKFNAHPRESDLYEESRFNQHNSELRFEEIGEKLGIRHSHKCFTPDPTNDRVAKNICAPNAAAAVADIDNDGLADLFFTTMKEGETNFLYRNRGDGTFEDVTLASGLGNDRNAPYPATTALFFDFDNDGDSDLLVLRAGCHSLYRNQGAGKFVDSSEETGIAKICGNAAAVNALDYDRDGDLDLVIANFWRGIGVKNLKEALLPGTSMYSSNRDSGQNLMLRNDQGRAFNDVSEETGIDGRSYTWAIGVADFDHDGFPDLFFANDFGPSTFFHNQKGKNFRNRTRPSRVGTYGRAGMNAEIGDLENRGTSDIYVTNITWPGITGFGTNTLWRGNGDGTFEETAKVKGVARCGWGWGAKFADFNLDGWQDIFVTNGFFSGQTSNSYFYVKMTASTLPNFLKMNQTLYPSSAKFSLAENQENCLFLRQGERFVDVAKQANVNLASLGKAVAIVDHRNEGKASVIVTRSESRPYFLDNIAAKDAHWIGFKLQGSKSNRDAWGARVLLTTDEGTQSRELFPANGFKSQSDARILFGLGKQVKVRSVEIHWPSGIKQLVDQPRVDSYQLVVENGETDK